MAAKRTAMSRPYHSRFGSLRYQMDRVSRDHDRRIRQAWIDRLLAVLDEDNLIARAAKDRTSKDGLTFECNFAPEVWDEPRIAFRRKQLAANDVTVELVDHEHYIDGRAFIRKQVRVTL